MRIARNLALLAVLLLVPFAANAAAATAVAPSCGDCTCDTGQCCDKSWTGGCSCHTCKTEIE